MHRDVRVSIVIVNYNSSALTLDCVRSFYQLCRGSFQQMVIVDCASRSEERERLVKEHPRGAELIFLAENRGYTGGNNAGILHALRTVNPEYVLLVNPDTRVINGNFLNVLVEFMENVSDAGVTGPLVYWQKEGVVQNTILEYPFLKNLIKHKILWMLWPKRLPHSEKIRTPMPVSFLNGVCILIRSKVFTEVGFFDEDIFMYVEDADFQWRCRQKGWKNYFIPVPAVVHLESGDYSLTSHVARLIRRNTFKFLRRHACPLEAASYRAGTLLLDGVRMMVPRQSSAKDFFFRVLKDFRVVSAGDPVTA